MGMRVVSTCIKWMGQEADGFHVVLKLGMNGAVLDLSLNAFIVMIASKQIKHELFFFHMWDVPFQECSKDSGCPGRSILWFPLLISWQTMGYCKLGGGYFHNPSKIFANQHTISVKTSVVC
jgi:hypothetical protein